MNPTIHGQQTDLFSGSIIFLSLTIARVKDPIHNIPKYFTDLSYYPVTDFAECFPDGKPCFADPAVGYADQFNNIRSKLA